MEEEAAKMKIRKETVYNTDYKGLGENKRQQLDLPVTHPTVANRGWNISGVSG